MRRVRSSGRFLIVSSLLTSGVFPNVTLAQPAPLSSEASAAESEPSQPLPGVAHERALATFKEGIAAFDRRDFEAARVAFLQTFALKPTAAVVRRNLGLAEIYSGYYLEGARRLARVIHTTDEGTPQDRARMLESLKKAEAHLERVTVEVNVEGAQIMLGGVELGSSPLPFAWYLPPGSYEVRVVKPGFATFTETRLAQVGSTAHLRIRLEPEQQAPVSSSPVSAQALDSAPRSRLNPWVLAAGGALTAGGLATGLTFTMLANDNAEKVERLGDTRRSDDCKGSAQLACSQLSDAAEAHDRQVLWASISFATAGAAALSTLLYALLTTPSADEPEPPAAEAGSGLTPALLGVSVERGGGGLFLHTRF